MRKIRETLRLSFDHELSQHEIARAIQAGQPTVHDYLTRFRASGLSWPLPDSLTDRDLEQKLFPPPAQKATPRPQPDFARIEAELKRDHVTLDLLWREYREAHPEGYSYSRYCFLYERWKASQGVVMRQEHKAGEKCFVDWAGTKLRIRNRETGEVHEASLFVAVLGASNFTYAEAAWDEQLPSWIGAHLRAFEYFGGTPELLVPDNTKTAVTRACRYDPDLNATYYEMAKHYHMGIVPARKRKPKDKAKVEGGVLVASRWILAVLRNVTLFSLEHANRLIRELLEKLNHRPFKKRPGSRWDLFRQLELGALRPLPAEPYDQAIWLKARVHPDHHVQAGHEFYSVPYQLIGESVEVRVSPRTIEILHQGQRVASHVRCREPHKAVTDDAHRPPAHQAQTAWTLEKLRNWAALTGPFTAQLVESVMAAFPHPEMGFRSCLGILRRAQKLPAERVEAVAERTLAIGGRYKSFCSILAKRLDQQPLTAAPPKATPAHGNIRGAGYFVAPPAPAAGETLEVE